MKKISLFIILLPAFIHSYGQIVFEKGYYIDNDNQKHECLIKNGDWKNNPTSFEFKMSEGSEVEVRTIETVKEFGFYEDSRYYRDSVKIDRSSASLHNMSEDRNPVFKEEVLFLKVLVEGTATLYEYADGNLIRYFYRTGNGSIQQLIYKPYRTNGNDIGKNVAFRQQLLNDLKCPSIKSSRFQKLEYGKKALTALFSEYSACTGNESNPVRASSTKRDNFNLTIRPRLTNSSLNIEYFSSSYQDASFDNKSGFGIGIEGEYILPFRRNKWSILVEPTYQSYQNESRKPSDLVLGKELVTNIDYRSIEVPVGVRHYFFLNKQNRLFLNVSYIVEKNFDSSIEFKRKDGSTLNKLDIGSSSNLAAGIGFKYRKNLSIEVRYHTKRELLKDYLSHEAKFGSLSVILGFSLF